MSEQQLRDMIAFAADVTGRIFQMLGTVSPKWHAVTNDGREIICAVPADEWSLNRDAASEAMRRHFAEHNVERYVFMDEAWQLEMTAATDAEIAQFRKRGIQDHPLRREVIMYVAEDRNGLYITAHRDIIRNHPMRPRAFLGPLTINPPFAISEGRLVGMLAPRGAMQ